MKLNRIAVSVLFAGLSLLMGQFALASEMRTERVRFPAGATGTSINGTIKGYESVVYTLDAQAGQVMDVSLSTAHTATYFNVYEPGRGPGDQALAVGHLTGDYMTDLNRFSGVLPQSGKYSISVYMMRSAARRNEVANYRLDISISARGSAAQLPTVRDDYADGLEGGPDYWEVTGVASDDTLNVREGPSTKARILARVRNGTVLRNDGCRMSGGQRWCRVETVRGGIVTGWVAGRYLREGSYR